MSFLKLMRYRLVSVSLEGYVLLDSAKWCKINKRCFRLIKAVSVLEDGELLALFVWTKCLSASPVLVRSQKRYSVAGDSSCASILSWWNEVSMDGPKGKSSDWAALNSFWMMYPKARKKYNTMLISKAFSLHFIGYVADIPCKNNPNITYKQESLSVFRGSK